MSHRIESNLKGELGMMFLEQELQAIGVCLASPHSIKIEGPTKNSKGYKDYFAYGWDQDDYFPDPFRDDFALDKYRWEKIEEEYGTPVLPDFRVKGTKILIEVKTGPGARLEKNQLSGFPRILAKGYRIFIVRPILVIEKRKFEVTGYHCTEFLGLRKSERIGMEELTELLLKAQVDSRQKSTEGKENYSNH